jgi:hypothetical protein
VVAKSFQASDEALACVVAIALLEVRRSEVGVTGSASEQRVDDYQE